MVLEVNFKERDAARVAYRTLRETVRRQHGNPTEDTSRYFSLRQNTITLLDTSMLSPLEKVAVRMNTGNGSVDTRYTVRNV